MLTVDRVIHSDDFVGTVRRTLRSAAYKQLSGEARKTALLSCRKVAGGVLVKTPPKGATVLKYEHGGFVIPVDVGNRLIVV